MLRKKISSLAIYFCIAAMAGYTVSARSRDWTPSFRDGVGQNEPLCRLLLKRIQSYFGKYPPGTGCSMGRIITSYPQFSEPGWEVLNPEDHMELLYSLISSDFSENAQASETAKKERSDYIRGLVDEFLREGSGMLVLRIKPSLIYEPGNKVAEKNQMQTFVQKGIGPAHNFSPCTGTSGFAWRGGIHVVKPDLSGPDPNFGVINGRTGKVRDSALLLATHSLFMYNGKPILIGEQDIWRFSDGSLYPVCKFK